MPLPWRCGGPLCWCVGPSGCSQLSCSSSRLGNGRGCSTAINYRRSVTFASRACLESCYCPSATRSSSSCPCMCWCIGVASSARQQSCHRCGIWCLTLRWVHSYQRQCSSTRTASFIPLFFTNTFTVFIMSTGLRRALLRSTHIQWSSCWRTCCWPTPPCS